MVTKTIEIQVQNDHLECFAQVRKPILAVAELIWNAVDADADLVEVFLREDPLGGFEAIEVIDDGHARALPQARVRKGSRLSGGMGILGDFQRSWQLR